MEFANNNSISNITKITSLFFNSGFNLRISFSSISKEYSLIRKKLYTTKVGDFTNKINKVFLISK